MADHPMDAAPPDDLARAFALPAWVDQHDYRDLHTAIVARLRREAAGIPMNTIQHLMLERIAFNYIMIKYREETSTTTPAQLKDLNAWWLDTTKEFNKILLANQDKMREALLIEVQQVVKDVLAEIPDPETRRTAMRRLSEEFAAIEV